MQQWVRRYLQTSQRWYAQYKRARIRTFFAEGIERFGLPTAVEALPGLLHISVFLFFAGLVDFLININHTVAFSLLSAVVVGTSASLLIYNTSSHLPKFAIPDPTHIHSLDTPANDAAHQSRLVAAFCQVHV